MNVQGTTEYIHAVLVVIAGLQDQVTWHLQQLIMKLTYINSFKVMTVQPSRPLLFQQLRTERHGSLWLDDISTRGK